MRNYEKPMLETLKLTTDVILTSGLINGGSGSNPNPMIFPDRVTFS